ncbi:MAG: hypothetical protein R2746_00220 [Acidimicrobiales bacterium]
MRTGPGFTSETWIPSAATSAASDSVNPTTANFDAEYAASNGAPSSPAMEATLTMCPSVALGHARQHGEGGVDRAQVIDPHRAARTRRVLVEHRGVGADARVVDEDVDAPELLLEPGHGVGHRVPIGHVGNGGGHRCTADTLEVTRDPIEVVARPGQQSNRCPVEMQRPCGRLADPTRRPRDDGDGAVEPHDRAAPRCRWGERSATGGIACGVRTTSRMVGDARVRFPEAAGVADRRSVSGSRRRP